MNLVPFLSLFTSPLSINSFSLYNHTGFSSPALAFQVTFLFPFLFPELPTCSSDQNILQTNMSKATVELDFFGLERDSSSTITTTTTTTTTSSSSSKSQFQKFLHRQRSFRDIQSAISRINPELLKSVIASGSANRPRCSENNKKALSVPSSPKSDQINLFPALPVYVPIARAAHNDNLQETAPLTIFYNGAVSVFDVPRDKVESILKLAMEGSSDPKPPLPSTNQTQLLDDHDLNGDLPIARRKSLQRFLEKRKERMTCVSPYACYT